MQGQQHDALHHLPIRPQSLEEWVLSLLGVTIQHASQGATSISCPLQQGTPHVKWLVTWSAAAASSTVTTLGVTVAITVTAAAHARGFVGRRPVVGMPICSSYACCGDSCGSSTTWGGHRPPQGRRDHRVCQRVVLVQQPRQLLHQLVCPATTMRGYRHSHRIVTNMLRGCTV